MFFLGFRDTALFMDLRSHSPCVDGFFFYVKLLGYTQHHDSFAMIMGLECWWITVLRSSWKRVSIDGWKEVSQSKRLRSVLEKSQLHHYFYVTTVAAFVPWVYGQVLWMKYFPITLSVMLGSSLVVAIFFNSMLVSKFMISMKKSSQLKIAIDDYCYNGWYSHRIDHDIRWCSERPGTIMVVTVILLWLYKYVIKGRTTFFQRRTAKWLRQHSLWALLELLRGETPYCFTAGMVVMFVSVLFLYFSVSVADGRTKVEFFPRK
jgi:hypothetical protein